MRSGAIVFSSFVVTIDGALHLKIFNDPKEVTLKKKPCATTTATSCNPQDINALAEEGYLHSQHGEDRCLIEHYFKGVCHGKYLDIGALDGIQSSNTHALHEVFGWNGINVEIDPDNFEMLEYNRHKDLANVHAAVCSESQTVHYAHSAQEKGVGGIWEFASEAHREQWWPGMTLYNTIPMKCTPVQSILDRTVGTRNFYFDLATIDLEGAELSALFGIDFDRISFGVIIVEKNEGADVNQQIEDLLHAKGYQESYAAEECGGFTNMWYVRRDFFDTYKRLNRPSHRTRSR